MVRYRSKPRYRECWHARCAGRSHTPEDAARDCTARREGPESKGAPCREIIMCDQLSNWCTVQAGWSHVGCKHERRDGFESAPSRSDGINQRSRRPTSSELSTTCRWEPSAVRVRSSPTGFSFTAVYIVTFRCRAGTRGKPLYRYRRYIWT
jgi:hypothetical protein